VPEKNPGRGTLKTVFPYHVNTISGGIQESLKPGEPGIGVFALLSPLHEGTHIAAIQQACQRRRQGCRSTFFGLYIRKKTVDLTTCEMTAEERERTGTDQWNNATQSITEENKER
jgi:hypothetical protein